MQLFPVIIDAEYLQQMENRIFVARTSYWQFKNFGRLIDKNWLL